MRRGKSDALDAEARGSPPLNVQCVSGPLEQCTGYVAIISGVNAIGASELGKIKCFVIVTDSDVADRIRLRARIWQYPYYTQAVQANSKLLDSVLESGPWCIIRTYCNDDRVVGSRGQGPPQELLNRRGFPSPHFAGARKARVNCVCRAYGDAIAHD